MHPMNINSPSTEDVSKYLALWKSNDEYEMPDKSLRKLFTETYPRNDEMDDV